MKQASNTGNQQQTPKDKDTPIGALSVTAILRELSESKNISLLKKINDVFHPKTNNNLNSFSVANSIDSGLIEEIINVNYAIFESIQNIEGLLNWFINDNQYTSTADVTSGAGINVSQLMGDNQINNEFIATGIMGIAANMYTLIDILTSIDSTLVKIDYTLSKLNFSSNDKSSKAEGELFNFAEQIEKLKKVLDAKFISCWERFVEVYKDYIDKKHTLSLIATIVQIIRFSHTLTLFYLVIGKVTKKIRELSRDLMMLGLMFIIPPFSLGILALKAFIRWVKVEFNIKSMLAINRGMTAFKSALVHLVLAALAMNYVKWDSLAKLGAILVGLIIVLNKFTGKTGVIDNAGKPSITKKTTYNISGSPLRGMFGLCFGLMFLVIALNFVKTVNWQGALFVIGFIAILGATLLLFGKRKITGAGDAFSGMAKLAIGLAILIFAIDAANELNWFGAIAIAGFIIALGVALGLMNKLANGGGINISVGFGGGKGAMFTFALGLAVIILCVDSVNELNFVSAMKLVAFIAAIAIAINAPELIARFSGKKFGGGSGKMSGMFGFALGLAVIILCVDAISELNFAAAFVFIGFVAALIYIINYGTKTVQPKRLKLLTIGLVLFLIGVSFSIGFATLVISKNSWQAILTIVATVLIFTVVCEFVVKNKKSIEEATKLVPLMVIGFAMTNLAFFWLLSKVDLQLSQILLYAIGVGVLMGLTLIANKFSNQIAIGSVALLFLGAASILLAISVNKINKIEFNLTNILYFAGSVIILGLLAALFGIPVVSGLVIAGSIALLILSAISILVAINFSIISVVSVLIFPETINRFTEAIGILCFGLAKNILWILLSLPSVLLLLPVAVVTIFVAISLMVVSVVSALIFPETVNRFTESIGILCSGLAENSFWIILALPAALILMPIMVVTLISAIALTVVSVVSVLIFPETINRFTKGVDKLIAGYNDISLFSLIKAVPKSLLMVPIAVVSILLCLALKAIASIDIDDKKIDKFGEIIVKFIDIMVSVVEENSKKITDNKEAFQVIADMANAASSIVNVVEAMANMTVAQWGVDKKTGELKIIGRRQINDNDFDLVCRNMGKMMEALIKPLSIIASNDEWWDFGDGTKVKNPFGKINGFFGPKDDMSGVNRIKAIGDAFEKIPAIMQGFCNNPLLTDVSDEGSAKMQKLQENIGIFFDTIILCMNKLPQKSILDSWFDGTASWLKDTVKPVFEAATDIIKKITPGGKEGTAKWEYSKTPLCLSNVLNFWSTTALIAAKVEEIKKKKFDSGIATKVVDFYSEIEKLKNNQWLSSDNMQSTATIATNTKTLVDSLADTTAFNRITKNLQNTNKNVQAIVTNINKINIAKAGALERNLRLLTQAKTQEALRDVIEELKEMIGLLKEVQEKQVEATQQQTQIQQTYYDEEKERNSVKKLSDTEKKEEITRILQRIENYLTTNGLTIDLTNINQEIEEALNNCGLVDNKNSNLTYSTSGIIKR